MRKVERQRIVWALWLLGAVTSCYGRSESEPTDEPHGELSVFPGWLSEQEAYDALFSEFEARYPKVEIVSELPTDARAEFQRRLNGGPPAYDTFPYGMAESELSGQLMNLDALAAREGWSDVFADDVLRAVTGDGSLWAVPVSVMRVNTMIYNPQLLSDVGISAPPTSHAELTSACEVLQAAGRVCLALGVAGGWTASLWILDSVFPAIAGAEHSRRFLRGELSGDDALFVQTLETVAALLPFANADRGDLEWDRAARLVSTGQAAFSPTGEWVRNTPEANLGVIELMPHPGAASIYACHVEAFAVTADANTRNSRAVEAWLDVVASEAGQTAFNVPRATIPARRLEDVSAFDVYAQRAIESLADPSTEMMDTLSAVIDAELEGQVNEVLGPFVVDGDVAKAAAWFVENYALFQR